MSPYDSPSPSSSSQLFRVLLDKYWKGKISGDQFVDIVSNPAHTESFPCLCSSSSASSAHSIAESEPPIFAATSISLGFWKTVEAITDASETLNPKSANIPMFALIHPHHYPATVPRRFVRTERSVRFPDTPLPTIVEEPSPEKA